MSFDQLKHVSSICHGLGRHHLYVDEYKSSVNKPYELDHKITLTDQAPRLRLSSSCEAASNCLYSLAEIAAQFGNKVSGGILPTSFNTLRKKYESGAFHDIGLINCIDDFQWYKKVRELRTEWAHYSTIFIAEDNKEPILVVRTHRRHSDKEEFKNRTTVKIDELVNWINKVIQTIDNFGNFLLKKYILPSLYLSAEITSPVYDKNGFPIIKSAPGESIKFEIEKITVAEHLRRCGITILS